MTHLGYLDVNHTVPITGTIIVEECLASVASPPSFHLAIAASFTAATPLTCSYAAEAVVERPVVTVDQVSGATP